VKKGLDIAVGVPGIFIVHHNIPGQVVQEHSHAEHHLIIPLQGEVSTVLTKQMLSCGPGRMIYIAPDVPHVFKSSKEKGERLICMLDQNVWKKVCSETFHSQLLPSSQLCKELLYFILLNPKSKHLSSFVNAFAASLLEVLAMPQSNVDLVNVHREGAEFRPETTKAIQYAREHFQDVISMEELLS
jgi:AraC-like ligand binding domain